MSSPRVVLLGLLALAVPLFGCIEGASPTDVSAPGDESAPGSKADDPRQTGATVSLVAALDLVQTELSPHQLFKGKYGSSDCYLIPHHYAYYNPYGSGEFAKTGLSAGWTLKLPGYSAQNFSLPIVSSSCYLGEQTAVEVVENAVHHAGDLNGSGKIVLRTHRSLETEDPETGEPTGTIDLVGEIHLDFDTIEYPEPRKIKSVRVIDSMDMECTDLVAID